ncbi:MAG: phosphoenolpyruvate synthase [Syntrophaceae bacterium]|nr:phosphoenolpyruvate synthase [Syntrophaceae bacterium]
MHKPIMKYLLKLFNRRARREAEDALLPKLPLKDRYFLFQTLLRENNRVLLSMADMGEKLSGEYLFDRQYILSTMRTISNAVLGIIENLEKLTAGKYRRLYAQYHGIRIALEEILSPRKEVPVSDLTIPLDDLTVEQSDMAGGKIAHLGEIRRHLSLPVPEGFSITAYASKRFLEHNKLTDQINTMLQELDLGKVGEINEMSRRIQDMVTSAELPDDLLKAIQTSVENLSIGDRGREPGRVSVRSSAILEDGEFSFAGQYATFLNVPLELVPQRYKEVVASLFTPRAIFYYKTKGLSEEEIVMAVGVLRMINADTGGVMYTADPNDTEQNIMIINVARGLGKAVVDGLVEPDYYTVSKKTGSLVEKKITRQTVMLVCSEEGDIVERPVPDDLRGTPCLSEAQITTLFTYASALEKYYGQPQDIEWAIDHDGRLFILQSRRLKIAKVERGRLEVPRRIEGHAILLDRGIIACRGIGHGTAFVLKDEADLNDFPEGGVLVARHTSTKFVTVMTKALAIITDIGGVTGHMASLAREYRVPTILDTEIATTAIRHGQEITVDAFNGTVYEGKVEKLLEYASQKNDIYKDTPLYKTLDKVLKWVVPLNLIDPEGANFRPEHCKTFHDITRFAHEKAMAEMFLIGKGHDARGGTIPLGKEGPLDAHFLDMDGGVREGTKVATPEDILSIPFAAFLKGLLSIPWPEPRATDVTGFLGMMATIATTPESELYRAGQQSFALIASNYMNFSIRLGYHFSMVEAYAGENRNDNYIKYFFKGGGAAVDRRLRRVKLITELLKMLDFKVTITEDVINASLTKFKQADIEKKCMVLGKLTVYTKQLDLIMYNDALIDQRIAEFVNEHINT